MIGPGGFMAAPKQSEEAIGESLLKPAIQLGPRHCWYCGKQLRCKVGGGYNFALIKDPIGMELRVHKACVEQITGEGYTDITHSERKT